MTNSKTTKTIFLLLALMIVLQLLRTGLEHILFLFVERTPFVDDMATMLAMLLLTIVFLFVTKKLNEPLSIFPKKFNWPHILETLVFAFLIISTPLITGDYSIKTILVMVYSSVVTPIFEELIFRGYIWNKLNTVIKREWVIYIVSTILFAVWHFGYIDGIAFRVSDGLANVMLWKMITGLCFGIVLGALRLKTKNCYSTMLFHGIMNIFGR